MIYMSRYHFGMIHILISLLHDTHPDITLPYYLQISNIICTKSPTLNVSCLFLQYCLCLIHWSQVLSREWWCSWSSADRLTSKYIWVIDNFIAFQGATYIRGFTVPCIVIAMITNTRPSENSSMLGGSTSEKVKSVPQTWCKACLVSSTLHGTGKY